MASALELAIRNNDLLVIEDDSMTWNGTAYAGIFTEFTKDDSVEVGGYVQHYDASFYVRTALLPTPRPTVEATIACQGKTFKVSRVHQYPDDIAVELELTSEAGA